jgi:hypothetical protein
MWWGEFLIVFQKNKKDLKEGGKLMNSSTKRFRNLRFSGLEDTEL